MVVLTCCVVVVGATGHELTTHLHFFFHMVNASVPNTGFTNIASLYNYTNM